MSVESPYDTEWHVSLVVWLVQGNEEGKYPPYCARPFRDGQFVEGMEFAETREALREKLEARGLEPRPCPEGLDTVIEIWG